MLAAMELRERIATLPLSEAHLKALRWLCHQAKAVSERPSEHERDALLSAFCAWAAAHRPPDWSDLYLNENRWFSPLHQPLHYFMPAIAGA